MQNSTQLKPEHLLCAAGGLLVGAWWVENKVKEAAQSRAEHDDPEFVAVTCEEIAEVLDQWEPKVTKQRTILSSISGPIWIRNQVAKLK